ncbi:MAG: CHAT domain-containing protein, partial [Planctomycetota bacterium]
LIGWGAWREAGYLVQQERFAELEPCLLAGLDGLPTVSPWRPWLLYERAELARQRGEWSEADALLHAARAALSSDPDLAFAHDGARIYIDGATAQLLIELGLTDQARRWLELEEPAALASEDTAIKLASHLHACNFALAVDDFDGLCARVDRVLTDDVSWDQHAAARAQFRLRLGVGRAEQSRRTPALLGVAREALEAALADPAIARSDRVRAELFLAELDLRAQQTEAARERIARADALSAATGAASADDLDGAILRAVLGARLAVQTSAPRAALDAEWTRVHDVVERVLAAQARAPRRDGGLGILRMTRRRALWVELVRLELARSPQAAPTEAFEALLRAQALATLCRRYDELATPAAPRATGLASLAAALPDGWGCLQYLTGPGRGYVFLLDASGLRVVELAAAHALQALQRSTSAAAARREEPSADELRALGALLLPAEAASWVAAHERVMVCGLDALGPLPFELLPGTSGRPLGCERVLAHAPSLELARRLLDAPRVAPRAGALVCLASEPGAAARAERAELVELRGAGEYARAACERLGAGDALYGARASIVALEAALAAQPHALFLWGHGVRDGTRERQLGIAMSSDAAAATLWSEQLEALRLPPLCVLASCGAARGPERPGDEGVAHLGGAALLGGARSVLLPAATIGYEPTQLVLAAFERELGAGLPAHAALLAARRAAADAGVPGHAWAALQLLGFGREELPAGATRTAGAGGASRRSGVWIAVLGACVALAVALLAARRGARR